MEALQVADDEPKPHQPVLELVSEPLLKEESDRPESSKPGISKRKRGQKPVVFNHVFPEDAQKNLIPELIPLDEIENVESNREPNETAIGNILADWNPLRFTAIEVSRRTDETMQLINPKSGLPYKRYGSVEGWHRKTALSRKFARGDVDTTNQFAGFTAIPAVVFTGLRLIDEPAMGYFNDNDKRKQTAGTKSKFRLASGDEKITEIMELTEAAGFSVYMGDGRGVDAPYQINSIAVLEKLTREHGLEALRSTLRVQKEAWNGMSAGLGEHMLGGFIRFFGAVLNGKTVRGAYDEERMIEIMKTDLYPVFILQDANGFQNKMVSQKFTRAARSISKLYNMASPPLKPKQCLVLDALLVKDEQKFIKTIGVSTFPVKDGEVFTGVKYRKKPSDDE